MFGLDLVAPEHGSDGARLEGRPRRPSHQGGDAEGRNDGQDPAARRAPAVAGVEIGHRLIIPHYAEGVIPLLVTASAPPVDWRLAPPGYLGLIVVLVLFTSMVFLVRSFLKHARKAKEPWPGEETDADGS